MVRAPLYVHTTTEIRGHGRLAENGTSANASRTASSAGLGDRSARVRPKAQSSTSWPWRYHSSVQENTNTPAQDRKSTRLNSSHSQISYAVFCLEKKKKEKYTDG